MAEEQAAHHLLNVLEERGLNVDLDKILFAFEDAETRQEAAAWVAEYLHEDTLLTHEELELYQTLRKKGLLHQYESEGEPVRPILDHELASAIESLRNSTATIEAQCKTLEAQKNALIKIKALNKPNFDVEHVRSERRRKEEQELARLDGAANDIVASMSEQLYDIQREIDAEQSTLKSYLSERFSSDDQILSRLPGLVAKIITEPEMSEDEKSIEQWCKAIVSFRTAEIKARVDTVYLTDVVQSSSDESPTALKEDDKERKAMLQAEMEELYSEITSIAEMVVEHDIRKPVIETRDRNKKETAQARISWLKYILSTIEYMSKRLDLITESTTSSDEFQQALAHIHGTAAKRIPPVPAVVPTSPTNRIASNPLAFTPLTKLKPPKALDLPMTLQDALRYAGVSLNHDSIEDLQNCILRGRLEKEQKLCGQYDSVATSAHEQLAERLHEADRDLEVILSVLYKHMPFAQINLTSPKLAKQLETMEQKVEQKESELLDAEGHELSLRDAKVQAFIAKYGR